MLNMKRWVGIAVLGMALLAGGCATQPQPFDYQPSDEMKPGPGLFSGEDGVFTIYGEPRSTWGQPEDTPERTTEEAPVKD